MWKVFGYSFYGAVRAEDERCIALKCFMYERAPTMEVPTTEALTFEQTYTAFAEALVS